MKRTVFACIFFFLLPSFAFSGDSGIEVRVSDPKGLAIPGVTLALFPIKEEKVPPILASTDQSGKWQTNDIAPGSYRLFAAKRGYHTESRDPVQYAEKKHVFVNLRLTPLEASESRDKEKTRWIIRGLNADIFRLDGDGSYAPPVTTVAANRDDFRIVSDRLSEDRLLRGRVSFQSNLNPVMDRVFSSGRDSTLAMKTDFRIDTNVRNFDCFVSGRMKNVHNLGSGYGPGAWSDDIRYGVFYPDSPWGELKIQGSIFRNRMDRPDGLIASTLPRRSVEDYNFSWKKNLDTVSSLGVEVQYLLSRLDPGDVESPADFLEEASQWSMFRTKTDFKREFGGSVDLNTSLIVRANDRNASGQLTQYLYTDERFIMDKESPNILVMERWMAGVTSSADLKFLEPFVISPSLNYYLTNGDFRESLIVPEIALKYHVGKNATLMSSVSRRYMDLFSESRLTDGERDRKTAYGAGFEGKIGSQTALKFEAEFNELDASLFGDNPDHERTIGGPDIVALRMGGDTDSREIIVTVERKFPEWAVASFRSSYGQAKGELRFVPILDSYLWSSYPDHGKGENNFRYVLASIQTFIPKTETDVVVFYKWLQDIAEKDSRFALSKDYYRLDLQVEQSLPFLRFANAEWKLLFSVRNLLGNSVFDFFAMPELPGLDASRREFSSGIAVSF